MDIKKHVIDEKANKGIWLEYDGGRFLIASTKGATYEDATSRKIGRVNKHALAADPAGYKKLALESVAENVLLDWKGVNDGDSPIPYSTENALTLLKNAPDFREWVMEEAARVSNFIAEGVAKDAAAVKSRPEVADGV